MARVETADTLAALEHAKSLGQRHTLAICNVPESALMRSSELRFLTRAGPEIGVASTKAFTAQLAALLMLAVTVARVKGRNFPEREILAAHPAIGQRTGLSARSAAEQGTDADPEVLAELARLNAAYEERHGFRFVVFVNRRPKHEILEVLRARIDNPTDEELETALGELVAIAEDRWRRA